MQTSYMALECVRGILFQVQNSIYNFCCVRNNMYICHTQSQPHPHTRAYVFKIHKILPYFPKGTVEGEPKTNKTIRKQKQQK